MSDTPRYSLYYFDARGRAETIRLVLAHAGVAYEDHGVPHDQWRAKYKAQAPLGQMPWLVERTEQGVLEIPQSAAILRHLAREHGLYGKDEREHLAADVAAETAADLRMHLSMIRYSPGWADEAVRQKYITETAPQGFARLNKLLGDRAWFASDAPTYADLVIFDTLDVHLTTWPDCLADLPRLSAFADRVRALPTLKDYLAKRRPA